jgi:membrane-bound metal-dependent hydrolase YbcI (DUF457 family)
VDILTHIISGVAFGTVVSSLSKGGLKEKIGFLAIGGFGSALPDIDAISLWSKFDSTFGRLFGLSHSGKEIYSAKFWFSHHGFMHSFMACLIFGFLIGLIYYLIQSRFQKLTLKDLYKSMMSNKLYLIIFIVGFCLHLLEDIPTPSSSWDGIDLLWPSKTYIGGTGSIWWWNNYDIFLIVMSVIIINLLVLFVSKLLKVDSFKITMAVFVAGFVLTTNQIRTRDFDFNYKGNAIIHDYYEYKSKEIQKQILGNQLYEFMIGFDSKLKINF